MADMSVIEDVTLPDSNEEQVRLRDLWQDQPIVLVWLRHYG